MQQYKIKNLLQDQCLESNSTNSELYYKINVWNAKVRNQKLITIKNATLLQDQRLTCNNAKSELLILFLDHRLIAMVQNKKLITIWTLKLITRSSLECNSTKSETYYNLECNTTKSGTNL